MSAMYEARVEKNEGGAVEIEVSQVHPDAPSLEGFARRNVLWLVGIPAFAEAPSFEPTCPLGAEVGSFDAIFASDEGNKIISRYFDIETEVVRSNYNDDNIEERATEAGLEYDPDDFELTRDVVRLVRGILRVKLTAKDPKWAQHLTTGRTWDV